MTCQICDVYTHRMTFDITLLDTPGVKFNSKHKLLSVLLCSNVPGFESPECFVVSSTAGRCMGRFVSRANPIAEMAERLMVGTYGNELHSLSSTANECEEAEWPFAEAGRSNARIYR